jgi:hypothetical protein
MSDVTYVAFVPRAKRDKLRAVLQSENTEPLSWREKKALFGSEFYFSGPAGPVREAHLFITRWLASH